MCLFFHDPATTEIYTYLHTLSLLDARPIFPEIFMIVADPVGAGIVDSLQHTGSPNLTWEKIGQGFDADGVTVDSENGLQDALSGALKSGRTTLIGARIDDSGYVDQFNALRSDRRRVGKECVSTGRSRWSPSH